MVISSLGTFRVHAVQAEWSGVERSEADEADEAGEAERSGVERSGAERSGVERSEAECLTLILDLAACDASSFFCCKILVHGPFLLVLFSSAKRAQRGTFDAALLAFATFLTLSTCRLPVSVQNIDDKNTQDSQISLPHEQAEIYSLGHERSWPQ